MKKDNLLQALKHHMRILLNAQDGFNTPRQIEEWKDNIESCVRMIETIADSPDNWHEEGEQDELLALIHQVKKEKLVILMTKYDKLEQSTRGWYRHLTRYDDKE